MKSERRRPGRPPLDPAGRAVEVCLTLSAQRYDDLYARAKVARCSVPELVRQIIIGKIAEPIPKP